MQLVGDADTGGAGTEDDNAVLDQRSLAGPGASPYGGEVDRAGALHVIVEGEYVVAVAVQEAPGIAGPEILPVQQRAGKDLERGGHVGVDKGVIGLLGGPLALNAQIQRVLQQLCPVGTDVQHHRQGSGRVDAGRSGVDGELADRDVDASDAPVADAEDGLGVGGDDEVHLVGRQPGSAQGGLDLAGRIDAEIDAARAPVLVAVSLDGLADRGCVDDGQQLAEVVGQYPVIEHLVAVVQRGQVDVLVEGAGLLRALPVGTLGLLIQGQDPGWQQAGQSQRGTLGVGERGALVQPGIAEHAITAAASLPCPFDRVPPGIRAHGMNSFVRSEQGRRVPLGRDTPILPRSRFSYAHKSGERKRVRKFRVLAWPKVAPGRSVRSLEGVTVASALFRFDDSYSRQLPGLSVPWAAAPVAAPELLVLNEELAVELGADPAALRERPGVLLLAGQAPGVATVAQAYAGHQFGVYVPRLGDGRALLLGEVTDLHGRRRDLHLKGSGRTPFARGGDGKAAVGPMLREYLIGEAMHGLGIPSPRALAVVATGEQVVRERALPGAVLTRGAASH